MQSFKDFIKESPDIVFKGEEELTWGDYDARSFGWLAEIPHGLKKKYFMMAKRDEVSHYVMLENLFDRISSVMAEYDAVVDKFPVEEIRKKLLSMIRLSPFFLMPKASDFVEEILASEKILRDFADFKMSNWLNSMAKNVPGDAGMKAQLNYKIRSKVFNNSGRIWLKSKVISFWLTEQQTNAELIDEVFNYFSIAGEKRELFLVDVIDPKKISKEETSEKVLPSYKEFKSKKPSSDKLTDEQKKKSQEMMSKLHTLAGVKGVDKVRFGQAGTYELAAKKHIPLSVRQQAQTSESLSFDSVYETIKNSI